MHSDGNNVTFSSHQTSNINTTIANVAAGLQFQEFVVSSAYLCIARVTLGDHFGFCAVADHVEVTVRASVEFVRLFGCLDELFVLLRRAASWARRL